LAQWLSIQIDVENNTDNQTMKANFRLNNEWNCPWSPLLHFDKRQGLGNVMIFKMEYLNFRAEVLRIFLEMTPPGLFLGLMGFYQYDPRP
jgi:hypothetical protein